MRTGDGYIVGKCLNGDSEAFGLLVDKYKASIYALAYTRLRNLHDAEDVTQEVFIKAFTKLNNLRQWDNFHVWLYSITLNECKGWFRKRSRRADREYMEDQNPEILSITSIEYHNEKQNNQNLTEQVLQAVGSLPKIYREVIILRYFGEMKDGEIAEMLGISHDNVRIRLTRARALLKDEIFGMIAKTFADEKLRANFTFNIIEIIKHTRITPISQGKTIPWGISITAFVLATIIGLNTNIVIDKVDQMGGVFISGESKACENGEIYVDLADIPEVTYLSNKMGVRNNLMPPKTELQSELPASVQEKGGIWSKKADMPTGRSILSSCVVDNKIYVIGGIDQETTLRIVEEYNPLTGEWKKKADMPNIRYSLSVSNVNGKIYVIGGWNSRKGINFSIVEEYDPKTDRWARKADMPTPRSSLSTSVVNGKIYVMGGNGGRYLPAPTLSVVEEYDPLTDAWTRKADMPTPRGGLCTAVVNGKIYAIGGITGIAGGGYSVSNLVSVVEEYDPLTDSWTAKSAKMPTPRSMFSSSVLNGKIYAIGGENRNISVYNIPDPCGTPIVEEYDPIMDVWTKKANMPTSRCVLSTAAVKEKIYAIGGTNELPWGKGFSTVEEYSPYRNPPNPSITRHGTLSTGKNDKRLLLPSMQK